MGRESDIQSQQQPDLGTYIPNADGGVPKNIPPGVPGTQPQGDFVVSVFGARPTSAYDAFVSLNDGAPSFVTSAGYVTILRAFSITAYLETTIFVGSTIFVIDRWGNPSPGLDLRFDLLQNNIPTQNLSNVPITDAAVTTCNIETYLPVDEMTTVTPQVRLGSVSQFTGNGVLHYAVGMRYTALPKTGVDTDGEAANKLPIPVRRG